MLVAVIGPLMFSSSRSPTTSRTMISPSLTVERFSEARLADVIEEALPVDQSGDDLLVLVGEIHIAGPDAVVEVFEGRRLLDLADWFAS